MILKLSNGGKSGLKSGGNWTVFKNDASTQILTTDEVDPLAFDPFFKPIKGEDGVQVLQRMFIK